MVEIRFDGTLKEAVLDVLRQIFSLNNFNLLKAHVSGSISKKGLRTSHFDTISSKYLGSDSLKVTHRIIELFERFKDRRIAFWRKKNWSIKLVLHFNWGRKKGKIVLKAANKRRDKVLDLGFSPLLRKVSEENEGLIDKIDRNILEKDLTQIHSGKRSVFSLSEIKNFFQRLEQSN